MKTVGVSDAALELTTSELKVVMSLVKTGVLTTLGSGEVETTLVAKSLVLGVSCRSMDALVVNNTSDIVSVNCEMSMVVDVSGAISLLVSNRLALIVGDTSMLVN